MKYGVESRLFSRMDRTWAGRRSRGITACSSSLSWWCSSELGNIEFAPNSHLTGEFGIVCHERRQIYPRGSWSKDSETWRGFVPRLSLEVHAFFMEMGKTEKKTKNRLWRASLSDWEKRSLEW